MTQKTGNASASVVCCCAVIAATVLLSLWILNDVLSTSVKLSVLAALLLAEGLALAKVWREKRRFATFPNEWNLIVAQAEYLRVEYANSDYGPRLEQIAETARYSDAAVSTDKERDVMSALKSLSDLLASSDAKAIEDKILELSALLEKRNIDARALQRGDY